MKSTKNLVTKTGLKKLKDELEHLLKVVRPKIASDLQEAKSFGDLSENSYYQDSRVAMDINDSRIAELEYIINNANLIDNDKGNKDGIVSIGDTVTLKSETGLELTIHVVGLGESDPANRKLSSDTPLVQAILGKKAKAKVMVDLPTGRVSYEILKVK
jgi:transcription elongation factor GreA